ncbi:uncharacterized protein LOC107817324 [Nicotiana tabacum]|uniref:Uncharacterized protein LOC107817324 n=1 Tax=Nicotiana tabacum TaxID=4097 RepID=A0A1S4CBV2_TOBAC|nr:PREDICTED: uncharacterized protein LOC107817324 [Nicotiana tabacum]
MDLGGRANGLEMELLNQSNYKVWKSCMESYLVGEDLWEVVNESNTSPLADAPKNSNARKKWKQINAKTEFVLKRSISPNLFDHIIRCKSAHEIWRTFDRLFNKKDEARLQILENELANTTQGNLSIAEYFLKVKNLCSEFSLLNPDEAISEARIRRIIIRGLKPEYIPFVTSIQGWVQQPSLEEFENFLSSQELLAKQMVDVSIKEGEGNVLVVDKRNFKGKSRDSMHFQSSSGSSSPGKKGESSSNGKKPLKYYRCGKVGHIKRYCRAKECNIAQIKKVVEEEEKEEDWGKCFTAETRAINAMASINFERNWIVDLGCGHHLTRDQSKFSTFREYNGHDVIVTADNTVRYCCDQREAKRHYHPQQCLSHSSPRDVKFLEISRYSRQISFTQHKSEVFSKFVEFKETVKGELDSRIRRLRTDNGGEFISDKFLSFCRQHAIKRDLTCTDTPQQNGVAERKILHLTETCKSWLHAKNFTKALWAEGMKCAVYVINKMPLSQNNMKFPYELMFGEKPSVKHLRVFGSICYVHISDSQRSKLDAKARKCIFVGYDERKKG